MSKAAKRGSIHCFESDPKYLRARLIMLQQKQQAFATAAQTQLGTFGVVGVRKKAFMIDTSSMLSDHFEENEENENNSSNQDDIDLDMPSISGISHAISSLVSNKHNKQTKNNCRVELLIVRFS